MANKATGYQAASLEIAKRNQKNIKWYGKEVKTRLVRIPTCEQAFRSYLSHSYFDEKNSVPPFACAKENDANATDPFDKAVHYLELRTRPRMEEGIYGKGNEDPEYVLEKRLRAKPRMMFGFYNIEDGQPFIIDLSTKQAEKLLKELQAKAKFFGTHAFELTRNEKDYTIAPYIDDLTKQQQQYFESCIEPFDQNLFESSLYFLPEEKQIEELHKIGLDVRALGYEVPTVTATTPPVQTAPPSEVSPTQAPPVQTAPPSEATTNQTTPPAYTVSSSDLPKDDIYDSSELEDIMNESETA